MGGEAGDVTLQPEAAGDLGTLPLGVVAGGRYRVRRFLAAGGMGEVYEADDLVVGTTIALKTLRGELAASARAVEGLRREIALARKVTHPNVCRLHDVGQHDGRVLLTMELLAGTTLAAHVKECGPLPLAELERVAAQLVAGLGALHAAGVVHRDFKTSNVMRVDDRVVITDFGLARAVAADRDAIVTVEASLRGTPAYMAPEQVEGRAATRASDIYALGVVLFELATGALPFREDTALATATARLHKEPPDPGTLRRDLPAHWRRAILRCLARDPAARPARVEDVLVARPRRRWWLATVPAAAVLVTVALAIAMTRYAPEPTRLPGHDRFEPGDPRAAVLYRRAMDRYRADNNVGAHDLLQEAVTLAPQDPIVLGRLAVVVAELGFFERATNTIAAAMKHADGLPAEPRLWLEANEAIFARRMRDAVSKLRTLTELAPDEYEYRVMLADTLVQLPPNVDTNAAVEQLRRFPGIAARAMFESMQTRLAKQQGDFARMLEHALATRALARRGAMPRLTGWSELWAAQAQRAIGDPQSAKQSYERGIALLTPLSDAQGVLFARKGLADIFDDEGQLLRKAEQYDQILAVARPLGHRELLLDLLTEGASAFMIAGRVAAVRSSLDEAIELARGLGDNEALAFAMLMRGRNSTLTGELLDARRRIEEAMQVATQINHTEYRAHCAANLAALATELDDEEAYRRWHDEWNKQRIPTHETGMLALRRGDDADARRNWTDALAAAKHPFVVAGLHALLAWSDARAGNIEDARRRFEPVRSTISRGIAIAGPLAAGRIRASDGDLAGALADLDAKVTELRAAGDVSYSMYIEVDALELAAAARDPSTEVRRAKLLELARKHGFTRRVRELSAR